MGVFDDPPRTDGERRPLSENVDVIIIDLEQEGLLLVVENRDASLHQLKFDFSQCENLKVDVPARGTEKTDRFKCQLEVPPKETMNLCHLKVVDVSKGGYDMRYRVAVMKRNAQGEMVPADKAPAAPEKPANANALKLPAATGPAAGADRKKLNEYVSLLIKELDDAYLFFLESEGTTSKYDVIVDFSESENMACDHGPDSEKTSPMSAKLQVAPVSRTPLARVRVADDKKDSTLKYKVSIKAVE
jgi:hypothetical protein